MKNPPPFHPSLGRAAAIALLAWGSCLCFQALPLRAAEARATTDLFDKVTVEPLEILVSPEAIKSLGDFPRTNVSVTVREGTLTYTNVALHLKGNLGSFRTVDKNPALTLHFNKFAPGQHFHGLDKVHLNNSVQDPTLVSEKNSRELFLAAGIPTARSSHATVKWNERDLGLYVLVEGIDRRFLKRHFNTSKGTLYDSGLARDITQPLEVIAGKDKVDQPELQALAQAAELEDLSQRSERLHQLVDMDRFVSMLALETILWHWDGYGINRNNYRLYHDLETGRITFIPHGLDQTLANPTGPLFPEMKGLVAARALEIPQLRERYVERVGQLLTNLFVPSQKRVGEIARVLEPVLKQHQAENSGQYLKRINDYKSNLIQRSQSLQQQLDGYHRKLSFSGTNPIPLSGWTQKSEFGRPEFAAGQLQEGRKVLLIRAKNGSSIGLWTTRVWLGRGSYRFQGQIKTVKLQIDPGDRNGGAGLRPAFERRGRNLPSGDTPWQSVGKDFEVSEVAAEVELVCELRATSGEAWFEEGALQLLKRGEGKR